MSCHAKYQRKVIFYPHSKSTQGSQKLRALQWHADEHPTDPLVSSNRVCPRVGQTMGFLSWEFWYSCCQAGANLWSTEASHKKPEILGRRRREWACLRQDSQEHCEQDIHLQGHSGLRCWARIPSLGALTTRLWATQYHSDSIFSAGITPVCTNSAMFIETARDWLYNLSWDAQLRWAAASLQHLCCHG